MALSSEVKLSQQLSKNGRCIRLIIKPFTMKDTCNIFVLFFLLVIGGNIHSQSPQGFSEMILGSWKGAGTLFGQKASFNMRWENELNSSFVELTFENRFSDKSGVERVMNAIAYYHLERKKGHWFDSRGVMLPLDLQIDNLTMIVLWGDEGSERGKTIYSFLDKEHLSVEDFVFKDDSYVPFGKALYIKD